jgi:hypothetical protein
MGELDSLLDQIDDASDAIECRYNFESASKWMPLLYYDQIKARNTSAQEGPGPALPFFLDFSNITEEQSRISKQLKQEARNKRNLQQQQID